MNGLTRLATLLCTLALVAVSGCGGGGGGTVISPPPPPIGGITRNGVAVGPVTTFGSIVVNGVHYDTAATTFTNDGQAGSEADLKVGQVVLVQGTIADDLSTGTADSVTFDDAVKGPIDSIDPALSQIVVLGQTVFIRPGTSFDDNISPASIDGLAVPDIVEVSGLFTATGEIEATRVEKKPAGTPFEVHGTVSNSDAANFMFSLNALTVDYSAATLDNFPGGQISDGDFVEAKGVGLGGNDELLADKVELESTVVSGAEGTHVEIEGFITRFASATDFDVSGTPVVTNASTQFTGGVAADLGLNIKVEVEGQLDANDVLVADKVDIRRGNAIRATALVDSVDPATESFVTLGITVTTDTLSRFEDKSSTRVRPLTIGDISMGDYVDVRGQESPAGSGQIVALIVERNDVDTRTILQGFVTNVTEPTLTILGVTIKTTGAVFRDVDGSVLTAAQFFNLVAVNSLVKARGTETSATTITATEVQLEIEL